MYIRTRLTAISFGGQAVSPYINSSKKISLQRPPLNKANADSQECLPTDKDHLEVTNVYVLTPVFALFC